MRPDELLADPGRRVFEIAFICTGNRARSPFAAELLRRYSGDLPIVVHSFGTLDLRPGPVLPKARRAARPYGVDLTPHRSTVLAAADLANVDLAIGFESFHVAAAVVTGGIAKDRAFLLTELADLLERMPFLEAVGASPSKLLELANAARTTEPVSLGPIADPAGRSDREFASTFDCIERRVAVIATWLGECLRRSERASRHDP